MKYDEEKTKELMLAVSQPVGTFFDFTKFNDMSQKELSAILSYHGWKKDYNTPGMWTRVCLWPYLSYYDGLRKPTSYVRKMLEKRAVGKKAIMNKDVNVLAGMRLKQRVIDVVMPQLGYELDEDIWRLK